MSFPTYGSTVTQSPLSLRSRCLVHWAANRRSLTALTGQAGVLTRGATGAATDSFGVNYTAVGVQPRWEARDLTGGANRNVLGLYMGTSDRLAFPVAFPVFPVMHGMIEFIQTASMASCTGGCVFYLGNDGVSGARLFISTAGSYWDITHHQGVASVSSSMSAAGGSAIPAVGNLVRLRFTMIANGQVQLFQSLNGGAEQTGSASGTTTPASVWGSPTFVRLNSYGSGTAIQAWYRSVKLVFGAPTEPFLSSIL